MKPYLYKYLLVVFCLTTFIGFSQEKSIDEKGVTIPTSIYIPSQMKFDLNSVSLVNDRLDLKNYTFLYLDTRNIEDGYFTLPLSSIGQTPTKYIYDTYSKVYHTKNLKQAFFKVSDLYKVRAINPLQ